jgi:hypothetical protein
VIIEKDGDPWFIGKEIADILGYSETSKMLRRLDDDESCKIAPPKMGDANNMTRRDLRMREGRMNKNTEWLQTPELAVAVCRHIVSEGFQNYDEEGPTGIYNKLNSVFERGLYDGH